MKITVILLICLVAASCGNGRETSFTGSTPAGPVVKSFLGIPLTDSVDFIRWKLVVGQDQYQLHCNYGIGKPNTNGFINGGKQVELTGTYKKENNYYQFFYAGKSLEMSALNNNLLHLLDTGRKLLVGNGGWSYTLNNMSPSLAASISIHTKPVAWKDSIVFEGRTPCGVPGIVPAGKSCYKLKWQVVLYASLENGDQGRYKVFGTPWRGDGGRKGNLEITRGKNGHVIYRLNDDKGKGLLYLLQLDEHILVFIDNKENLLVGDHDFSYTLNRIR